MLEEGKAMEVEVSWFVALAAGALSFFTPCILPILPAYLSFITGKAVEEIMEGGLVRSEILPPVLLFCLGFSTVFVILGATATALGQIVGAHQRILEVVGGLVVILFGLQQIGILRLRFLEREKRVHLRGRPAHAMGAFVVGVAFAAGWTPCLGPVLGAILAYAGTRETVMEGVALLSLFSVGMSLPFVTLGVAMGAVLSRIRAAGRFTRWVGMASGVILMLLGVLLVGGQVSYVLSLLY